MEKQNVMKLIQFQSQEPYTRKHLKRPSSRSPEVEKTSVTTPPSADQISELQHCFMKQLGAGTEGFNNKALGELLQDYRHLDPHNIFPFLCFCSKGIKLCHLKDHYIDMVY